MTVKNEVMACPSIPFDKRQKAVQKNKNSRNRTGYSAIYRLWQLAVISVWSTRRRPCSFAPRAFAPFCLLNNSILQLIRTFVKNYKNQLF